MFLDIGTCPLHVVHNSFCKGVTALNFDVDQYALDIYFFFKLSAGRRADYKSRIKNMLWSIPQQDGSHFEKL